MTYTVNFEQGATSWGATVPDLPGCIAVAESLDELRELIREAIGHHIEMLREDGIPVPPPVTKSETVEVAA